MIRSRCAFCGGTDHTRSALRIGKDWFCSEACIRKHESFVAAERQFRPQSFPTSESRSTQPARKRPRRTPTTLAVGLALAGVGLIVWAAPSLHLGKAAGQRVSGAAAFRYL